MNNGRENPAQSQALNLFSSRSVHAAEFHLLKIFTNKHMYVAGVTSLFLVRKMSTSSLILTTFCWIDIKNDIVNIISHAICYYWHESRLRS